MLPPRLRSWPAAGLVLLLLIAGAVVMYLSRGSAVKPSSLVGYFPAREATILYIDLGAIRSSGVLEKLVGSTVGEDPAYRTFVQQTGFDYKRDLDQAMLNSAGGVHYFVLQGRFDWQKLKDYANAQGGSCRDDYCHMKGSTPDRIISWRRLRRDLMALASARDEAGARAIEERSPEALPFSIPATPLWLHMPGEAIRSATQAPTGTKMFLKAIAPAERAVFTLGPDKGQFQIGMDVVCRNAEEAAILKAQLEELTKLLSGLIAREKKAASAADLSGVLTSGTFDRLDTHVRGRWAVQRAFIDSLGGS